MRSLVLAILLSSLPFSAFHAAAQDLRVPLPKRSKFTPVQQLNRDGVKALQKHDIAKAKRLFYKAYLVDPNDPFTLNNLGYVSELEGDLDRAQRYYDLAEANTSEAVIDRSTEKQLEGKVVSKVAGQYLGDQMKVNQLNTQAVRLLNQDRAPEADLVLQHALKIDPNNPFALNNLGFAKEKEGDLEGAIKSYQRAASTGSQEKIVVTANKDWRGKPISEIAQSNAANAEYELTRAGNIDARVARLNLQGVSAMNRNDRKTARADFLQAFKLDPGNSFTLNNMGYLAELDGDKETAQTYYDQARDAQRSRAKVAVATRADVEGREMRYVAEESSEMMDSSMEAKAEAKRSSGTHPTLKTREKPPAVGQPANPGTKYTPPEFRRPQNQPSSQPSPQPPDNQKKPPPD
ncbi:MAG TPA: tetratricopeptide repeat protein [Candidatus Angelobacter sp.]